MTRDDIIKLAREADVPRWDDHEPLTVEHLERFAALVAAAEREEWPRLDPVITWLENGCDPAEAAKELRIYAAAIRARENT